MEQQDLLQMTAVLKNAKLSRNDFICALISTELAHIERFRALNTNPDAPHYTMRQAERRTKTEQRKTQT
jgi:hypothetical protein